MSMQERNLTHISETLYIMLFCCRQAVILPGFTPTLPSGNIWMLILGVVRSIRRKKNWLCLRHLVQQVLSYRLLLHLPWDAVGGIVVLHIKELSLIGGHAHHPLLPVQKSKQRPVFGKIHNENKGSYRMLFLILWADTLWRWKRLFSILPCLKYCWHLFNLQNKLVPIILSMLFIVAFFLRYSWFEILTTSTTKNTAKVIYFKFSA